MKRVKVKEARYWKVVLKSVYKPLATLLLLAFSSSAYSVEPSSPGDLRYEVYSSTSAELFWDRASDDGYVVEYEVQINNTIVESRDALSYYSRSFTKGQTYNVVVTTIDDEGDRSAPASLSFIGGDKTTPVELPDADPVELPDSDVAAPTGLLASVYSSSSIELFWDRPDASGLTYEVSRAGLVLVVTDGISYYDRQLTAGTEYNYQVTAINALGERSNASAISATTKSGSGGTTEPPFVVTGPIAAPTGLTSSVYSRRSAEIVWDRPATLGLTYDVSRDGVLVATTDGVSFYDNELTSETTYTYEVVAIAAAGGRSAPTAITLSTPAEGGTGTTEPPIVVDGPIVAPTGLISKIYSDKSAELFWDRSDVLGLTYEVTRNGVVVNTTDGISFYDRELKRATAYTYEVVAIAGVDRRSTPAVIMFNTSGTTTGEGPDTVIPPMTDDPNIAEPADLYEDGYSPVNVIRVDLRTVTEAGICNADDESGCTLADVIADTDKFDDHTVDINVHFQSDDFADDGSINNAELRLRGGGSRFGAQKSFRIKLDSKQDLWRRERHLQLNKHPFESSRIRNKLAMDVMSEIPNLPSMRTQFVNLWIDDGEGPVDYGLFTHVERVNQYFLSKRGWNEDDNLYKAEYFQFNESDLANLQLDEDGEALDEDLFERTLGIENGNDHRTLVAMITALNDPDRNFESVLDQYFDRSNVMAWISANILLRQKDAVRHNFILYNPIDSDKFYFIPWDYDEAMGAWKEAPNDLSSDSLRQRTEYGYALAARNTFLEKFYRLPGIHDEILAEVENIRQNYVTNESMAEKANHYINLVAPFQERAPDSVYNPEFSAYSAMKFTNAPGENEEALRSRFGVLIGPMLAKPTLELAQSQWRFSWQPAYDVTAASGNITYRLQVASTPTFDTDSIAIDIDAIEDAAATVEQSVDVDQLPTGEYFARLIATPANQPERFWQVSGNKLYYNNQVYYGALRFVVP